MENKKGNFDFFYDKFYDINRGLNLSLKDSELNYARFILPSLPGEVAVVAKYAPNFFGNTYFTLNAQLNAVACEDWTAFYYGASPELNSSMVVEAISALKFKNEFGLQNFISEHARLFMVHKGQEKFLLPLAKYIVLCFAYNYGIKIDFKDESLAKSIFESSGMIGNFLKLKGSVLTIHGCPCEQFLSLLRKYKFTKPNGQKSLVISDKEDDMSIDAVYANRENIILTNGDVFYSGVLLRTLHIEERNSWHSNRDLTSVCLHYERSTFATVFALDNNLTDHPVLKNDRAIIAAFFNYDDNCKIKNLNKPIEDGVAGRKKLLTEINEYLKHSYNVNQVGITGNIISSDGFLLYTERGAVSIDSKKLYPSVNGNAEIADESVEFYNDSADVDFPSMHITSSHNSFGAELCRETEAELNLSLSNNLWKCYGLIISGILPKDTSIEPDYLPRYRRLHFNILFEQKTDLSLDKIRELQFASTESYENECVYGLQIKTYKSNFYRFKKLVDAGVRKFLTWRLVITNIFTLALFILTLTTNGLSLHDSLKDWSTITSATFAILITIMTSVDIVKWFKKRHQRAKYQKASYLILDENLDKKIDKLLEQIFKNRTYHPVSYLALKLYLIKSVYGSKE